MARPLIPDDVWTAIAPLLTPPRPRPKDGRPPIENRAALTAILFVLRSGLPWEILPAEMGCGCGMSCWRRLRDWQVAGVLWARLHQVLLKRLHAAGAIDWRRVSLDSAAVPAKKGACHRPEPGGPGHAGHEAPPRHRRLRQAPHGEPVEPWG
jgi:transposase